MNESTKNTINKHMSKIGNKLGYLYDRWQDEKEYEDWTDYETEMKKLVNNGDFVFVSSMKRPFGLKAKIEDWVVKFTVTSRDMGWSAVKV